MMSTKCHGFHNKEKYLLRKIFNNKNTEVTISVHYKISGAHLDGKTGGGVDTWPDYTATNNEELARAFYQVAILCGTKKDKTYQIVSQREVNISLTGKINGVSVDNTKLYSVIELAEFLKSHKRNISYYREEQKEKIKAGDITIDLTDVHIDGVINGKLIEHQDMRSTSEILLQLNRTCKDTGFSYQTVRDDQIVLTKDELRQITMKAQNATLTRAMALFGVDPNTLPGLQTAIGMAEARINGEVPVHDEEEATVNSLASFKVSCHSSSLSVIPVKAGIHVVYR